MQFRILIPVWIMTGLLLRPTIPRSEYTVRRVEATPRELLSHAEPLWLAADGVDWGPADARTEFRALWTERGLAVRFDVTDREPWHNLTDRDDRLWEEEVVEIFLDPSRTGAHYVEVEWSPANVVCDLLVISGMPNRKADIHWNLEGLQSRTDRNRDDERRITGWTLTAFLPWTGFESIPTRSDFLLPPRPGDRWRFNVFRIERPGGKNDPERDVILAAWSPPPGRSFHVPEVFRDLVFTGN